VSDDQWITVDDNKVRNIWKADCDCNNDDNECVIHPDWYQNNGTPTCGECGQDYIYESTEIKHG
jgi:hypothetical protein